MDTGSHYLADELERLARLPLGTPAEVEQWYEQAGILQSALQHRFPGLKYPHDLVHYFSDADIRSRESGYREQQEQFVTEYISTVRRGT